MRFNNGSEIVIDELSDDFFTEEIRDIDTSNAIIIGTPPRSELHKRLTRIQDEYFSNKASKTRFENYHKKFFEIMRKKEKEFRIQELIDSGMSDMEARFHIEYGKNISLYNPTSFFINRIKKQKTNFVGAKFPVPKRS